MVATQGHAVLKARPKSIGLRVEKAKTHTERNVIEEQSSRKDLFERKPYPPPGNVKQPIVVPLHLISICHSED
jgi:hypothetical protein